MKKIKVKINDQDKSIIMRALIDKRNNQLKENSRASKRSNNQIN